MKKVVIILIVFMMVSCDVCFAAELEWKETNFGKYLAETAYVKSISDEKGSETLCCNIFLKENGDIELGAEEPDKENDKNIFLSRIFISEDGKTIKPSSSSGEVQRYGSGKILYYSPKGPGYDVFSKNCRSFMKADNIPANIRKKIVKALDVYTEQASK